jgi:hypothetical protein
MADWFADDSLWREVFPFEFGDEALAYGEVQAPREGEGSRGGSRSGRGVRARRHARIRAA